MKNLFLLLLLPVFACGQSNEVKIAKVDTEKNIITEGFIVTGNVQGVSDGEVKITSLRNDQTLASGNVKGGAFALKGSVAEPGLYWLTIGNEQPRYLFLENSPIKITGTKANIKKS